MRTQEKASDRCPVPGPWLVTFRMVARGLPAQADRGRSLWLQASSRQASRRSHRTSQCRPAASRRSGRASHPPHHAARRPSRWSLTAWAPKAVTEPSSADRHDPPAKLRRADHGTLVCPTRQEVPQGGRTAAATLRRTQGRTNNLGGSGMARELPGMGAGDGHV